MGEDHAAPQRLAPQAAYPAPLAASTLRRHTPEVGAVCGNSARTDLCGGRPVMSVPTANTIRLCKLRLSCAGVWAELPQNDSLKSVERHGIREMLQTYEGGCHCGRVRFPHPRRPGAIDRGQMQLLDLHQEGHPS